MRTRTILLAVALSTAVCAKAQQPTLFDDGWQFTQNGATQKVDLPHDWDIYAAPNPASGATGTGGGWYPGGKGEYRKTFKTPDAELVKLRFDGVYQQAQVYVNGQKAGQHAYGYTPFTVDVTPYLYGKANSRLNEVVVQVDNSQQPNCRWYSGSGIYRHVWLQTTPRLHFKEGALWVKATEVTAEKAYIEVFTNVVNESDEVRQADDVAYQFTGGQFTLTSAPDDERYRRVMPRNQWVRTVCFAIEKPRLWSPDDPYLYEVTVQLKEHGRVSDEQRVRFGIRSFSFDAERGFVLNGEPLLLNGACMHHDNGVLGAMAFDAAEVRKVRLMKEAGFNLIRTSHNPPSTALLDACDELGMLVIDEAFDGWRSSKTTYDYSTVFDSCAVSDIRAMVLRDRNHPSIISWSIGNEVIERKELRVVTTARELKRAIEQCDNTRPVTEALCAWDRDWEIYDPHFEVLDVAGYNYMIFKHAGDHQRDPKRVMWQTESYPRDAFQNWAYVHDYPYIVGDIVWTGLDYLGESGIGRYYYKGETEGEHYRAGGVPEWHGAYCGDVDITGWRKPISHYRELLWNDDTRSYMAVREPNGYRGEIKETQWSVWPTWESWNWAGWEGKPIDVEVYTRAEQVSLYLNDRRVGTKRVDRGSQYKAVFTLPYEAGTLRAETSRGERLELQTAGEPATLRLTADRTTISADGQDLAFITVEVVDSKGRVVPEAAVDCNVSVSGRGRLMAAASADLQDTEPSTSSRVVTWKGRALIVVRSAKQKGKLQVRVKSALPTASLGLDIVTKKKTE